MTGDGGTVAVDLNAFRTAHVSESDLSVSGVSLRGWPGSGSLTLVVRKRRAASISDSTRDDWWSDLITWW